MLDETDFDPSPKISPKRRLPVLPNNPDSEARGRFPSWLHRPLTPAAERSSTYSILRSQGLPTVCEEARCPNRQECFSRRTATFLAMGDTCTRACGFCEIATSPHPPPLDPLEPQRIAQSAHELGLKHVVITMVARDDLEDGGAAHLVKIVQAVREGVPGCTVELLTSDLQGKTDALKKVFAIRPEIYNHNIETVRRLTPSVRHKATYERTLEVLQMAKMSGEVGFIKSGLMLGLGESPDEVKETLNDLKEAGCDIVTIGHYLQPSRNKLRVKAFVEMELFSALESYGNELGIRVYSGPYVRSSYNAAALLEGLRSMHGH
ncbi:MAG: lipoyl synthase [Chlamydiia bacterium]|nr:lipoyl synthase [Chlamydiia bacterium]